MQGSAVCTRDLLCSPVPLIHAMQGFGLGCAHVFCRECWAALLESAIKQVRSLGKGRRLPSSESAYLRFGIMNSLSIILYVAEWYCVRLHYVPRRRLR